MDPKFGKKRVCENCSTKFMDLNKPMPLKCPHCNYEISRDDFESSIIGSNIGINEKKNIQVNNIQEKQVNNIQEKDDESFDSQNDSLDENDDSIISLEDVEEGETEN